ncbi:SPBc2 prophage-derived endonuclease YokF [Peribacillus sp. Bi96]|uniref:thermonuclease family protein n=1 Tax=unclassified Peribacillus TaxID=2675266 RepID=UPI001D9B71A8|nr:thermonuclease family protein [Peribacillus sp. Bi96]CAH0202757.1 SPBc2 prophage-derived endonuclease YokF [Peribacillus sp. Bi96]
MNRNSFLPSCLHVLLLTAISLLILTGCQGASDILNDESQQENSTSNKDIQSIKDSSNEEKGHTFTAKIIRVVDGDTVKIKMPNGNEETVRLLLIDTPETVHPSKPVQPFGPEASKFTKDLMPAGSKVEVEPGIGERDKYGRLLAYFYVDGKMVNKLLLEKGLARVAYVYAPNTKYLDELENIQKQAQKDQIGIWSIENYATSKGFDDSKSKEVSVEKTTVNSSCNNPKIKGNINSKGNKIYHIPSGQYYEITKPEEMFCTEQDAQDAGFRKSQS